jgi:hypothetical protein
MPTSPVRDLFGGYLAKSALAHRACQQIQNSLKLFTPYSFGRKIGVVSLLPLCECASDVVKS